MKINFLDEEKVKREIRWDQIFLALMIIFLLLLPTFHYSYHRLQVTSLEREVDNINQQTNLLQPELETRSELNEKIAQYESAIELAQERYPVDSSLRHVSEHITPGLSLDSIDIFAGEMYVSGQALSSGEVVNYMERLAAEDVFSEARIDFMDTDDLVNFSIRLRFAGGEI